MDGGIAGSTPVQQCHDPKRVSSFQEKHRRSDRQRQLTRQRVRTLSDGGERPRSCRRSRIAASDTAVHISSGFSHHLDRAAASDRIQ
jgi:hypothetical protein